MTKLLPATCSLCGKYADPSDWCPGCQSYICLACGEAPAAKIHKPEDHKL